MNLTATGNVVTIQNQTLSGTYSNSAGDSVSIKDVTVNTGSNVTIESRNAVRVQAGFQSNGATVSLKPGVSTAGSGGSSYTGNLFMTYDASGQRVKYLKGSASAPQDGSRIYVRGSDGKILAEYIRSGSNWNLDHYNLYGNGLVGKLNSSSQRYYYLADHLGSNRVILKDNSGTASVESWSDYYPFGKISRSSETANTPSEKFTGYQLDIESDLNYAGARYYNSVIGRFISVDPMHQYASGYVYSGNNPTRYFDPTGLWGTDFFADMGHSDEYIEQVLSAKRREIVCYWATAASEREIGNGRFAVEFQDNSDGGGSTSGSTGNSSGGSGGETGNSTQGSGSSISLGDENVYPNLKLPFTFVQPAFLFAEGAGMHGSFNIQGNVVVRTKSGISTASIFASGNTAAKEMGGVAFFGSASLLVNNRVEATKSFSTTSGIWNTDRLPVGSTTFVLPAQGNVQLRLSFGYQFNDGGQGANPIFMMNRTINIPSYTIGTIRQGK